MRLSWRLVVDVIAPALFTCWIAYFAYDAMVGATGYRVLSALEAEEAAKAAEVAALTAERRRLEQIAAQLNPKSLDPDMVDEKIRSVLGYVAPGDVVVPRDQLEEILGEGTGK
ncbi:MAG: FtsB family cell division protein [Pseudomonadota bacterium]